MTQDDLKKKVLTTIQEKDIHPKPKWEFMVRNGVMWSFGLLSIVVGGLAIAVSIHLIQASDYGLYRLGPGDPAKFVMSIFPYFWILFLTVFVIIAQIHLRHTKKGYTFRIRTMVFGSIGLSVVVGGVLSTVHIGRLVDNVLEERYEVYSQVAPHHEVWEGPEEGMLGGKVILIMNEHAFEVQSIRGKQWIIDAKNADIIGTDKIEMNVLVRMIGEQGENNHFVARHIKVMKGQPFGPGRPMKMNFNIDYHMGERIPVITAY